VFAEGTVRWIGTASGLESAAAAIQAAVRGWTGPYLILNQRTGRKVIFNRVEEGLTAACSISDRAKREQAAV
jgi:hypothetical protein